jgi:hypothetical protein
MRLVLAVALVSATAAHASDDDEHLVAGAVLGGAVATYGVVQTGFMIDELLRKGYSEPSHTVPAGFLAGVGVLASGAWAFTAWRAQDGISLTGAAVATMSSAFMMMLVAISTHGWAIRQRSGVDTGS